MQKKKYLYLEAMRILACFFVIFNHTGKAGYMLFTKREVGSIQYFAYMFISIFCKFSVPIFFAISGVLLLSKEQESLGRLWKKRVLKIVVTLVVFSGLYYGQIVLSGQQTFDIQKFFWQLYDSDWNFSYWYLYAYIAMLMVLPFLRTMAKHLETKYFYYMFALVIFFKNILPFLQFLFWNGMHSLNGQLNIGWLTADIFFYPMLGYFLQYRVKDIEKKGKLILILWAVDIMGIALACYATHLRITRTGEMEAQVFHNYFVMINMATLFLTIKYLFVRYRTKVPWWMEKLICSLGGCTFGIYLWHVMILDEVKSFYFWDYLRKGLGINPMVVAFLLCFCVMVICFIITWVMKKIPILKNIV